MNPSAQSWLTIDCARLMIAKKNIKLSKINALNLNSPLIYARFKPYETSLVP